MVVLLFDSAGDDKQCCFKFNNMDWNRLKPIVESEIQKAKITNKEFIKLLLRLSRRINTSKNFLNNGGKWETMCETLWAYSEAYDILEYLKENHQEDFFKYCDANGLVRNFDTGDMMA